MIDRERLEEIKLKYHFQNLGRFIDSKLVDPNELKWLIQQAERVEELEEEKDEWKDTAQSYYMTNQELREQNKRYRKAINYIIKKVMLFGTNEKVYDAIQDALKALEVEK